MTRRCRFPDTDLPERAKDHPSGVLDPRRQLAAASGRHTVAPAILGAHGANRRHRVPSLDPPHAGAFAPVSRPAPTRSQVQSRRSLSHSRGELHEETTREERGVDRARPGSGSVRREHLERGDGEGHAARVDRQRQAAALLQLKTTSLLAFIGVRELFQDADIRYSSTFKPVEYFAGVAILYLCLTTIWGFIQAWIERKLGASERDESVSLRMRLRGIAGRAR
jgi:hypothetical protein